MYVDAELLQCIKLFIMANSEESYPFPNEAVQEKPRISDCLAIGRFILWKIEQDERDRAARK